MTIKRHYESCGGCSQGQQRDRPGDANGPVIESESSRDRCSARASAPLEHELPAPGMAKRWSTAQARCSLLEGVLSAVAADDGRPMHVIRRSADKGSFSDLAE